MFHLPGCHFGYIFLTHTLLESGVRRLGCALISWGLAKCVDQKIRQGSHFFSHAHIAQAWGLIEASQPRHSAGSFQWPGGVTSAEASHPPGLAGRGGVAAASNHGGLTPPWVVFFVSFPSYLLYFSECLFLSGLDVFPDLKLQAWHLRHDPQPCSKNQKH